MGLVGITTMSSRSGSTALRSPCSAGINFWMVVEMTPPPATRSFSRRSAGRRPGRGIPSAAAGLGVDLARACGSGPSPQARRLCYFRAGDGTRSGSRSTLGQSALRFNRRRVTTDGCRWPDSWPPGRNTGSAELWVRPVSFIEAALAILRESGNRLTTRQITDAAMDRGLLVTRGRTPEATLAAELYERVRRDPEGPLRRVAEAGPNRARRGSVRWEWKP